MEESVLQYFLSNNLINIDEDDSKYGKLTDSVSDLTDFLSQNIDKIHKFCLVAMDLNAHENEDVTDKVNSIIISHWKTFSGRSKDKPTNIIRAVILESLLQCSNNNIYISSIVFLTFSNYYHYLIKDKNEIQVFEKTLTKIGNTIEIDAVAKWSIGKLHDESFDELKVNVNKLHNIFEYATLELVGEDEEQIEDSNLNEMNTREWAEHFNESASKGISTLIDSELNKINKLFAKVNNNIIKNNTQNNLLWWQRTLYSKTLQKSYRNISIELLPLITAYDLSLIVEPIYPRSIDYLLKELVESLLDNRDEEISLSDFFEKIIFYKEESFIKKIFSYKELQMVKNNLIEYLQILCYHKEEAVKKSQELLGVDLQTKIKISELAIMLFHDFQVANLIKEQ